MKKLAQAVIALTMVSLVGCAGVGTKEVAIGAGAAALTYGLMHHKNKDKDHNVRDEQRQWDREHGYDKHHHRHYDERQPSYGHTDYDGNPRFDDRPNWER